MTCYIIYCYEDIDDSKTLCTLYDAFCGMEKADRGKV